MGLLAHYSSRIWKECFHCKDEEWHVVVLAELHKLERQKDFWRHWETWPTSQERGALGCSSRCCTDELMRMHTHTQVEYAPTLSGTLAPAFIFHSSTHSKRISTGALDLSRLGMGLYAQARNDVLIYFCADGKVRQWGRLWVIQVGSGVWSGLYSVLLSRTAQLCKSDEADEVMARWGVAQGNLFIGHIRRAHEPEVRSVCAPLPSSPWLATHYINLFFPLCQSPTATCLLYISAICILYWKCGWLESSLTRLPSKVSQIATRKLSSRPPCPRIPLSYEVCC